jgi:hypothetical protein
MSPTKARITLSDEAFRLEIDRPVDCVIVKPVDVIRGWFSTSGGETLEVLNFRLGGIVVPHVAEERWDVEEVLPEHVVKGFLIPFDLAFYIQYIEDKCLVLQLTLVGYDPIPLTFTIEESALAICLYSAGGD